MIASVLRAIPAPTDNWAEIVGHVAWPFVILVIVWRFQDELGQLIDVISNRFRHDNIRWGSAEITKNTDILAMDSSVQHQSSLDHEPDDIDNVEKLFELAAYDEGVIMLTKWIEAELGSAVDLDNFLTQPKYANSRADACTDLFKDESK